MLDDISDSFVRLYMVVARGRLVLPSELFEPLKADEQRLEEAVAPAEAAALQAAKTAHLVLPAVGPFQLTNCFTDLAVTNEGVDATVTLQAYHRVAIDSSALLAVAAALSEFGGRVAPAHPGQAPQWRLEGLHVVQSVKRD